MNHQTYKVVVLDLDGTLTNSKKEISKRNKEALLHLQQSLGVKVVLASGRPVFGIKHLADELQLSRFGGYVLAYNGGVIIDCKSGEQVYSNTLPDGVSGLLAQSAKEFGLAINTYDDQRGVILTETPDNEWVQHEGWLNNRMPIEQITNFATDVPTKLPKCLIVGEGDYLVTVEPKIREQFIQLDVYRSSPFFLEIVPKGIDKAASLARLSDIIGIEKEQFIAIGDGYNDLSMINFAGLGIAMGNACDEVKQAADFVSLDNDNDGVAHALAIYFDVEF